MTGRFAASGRNRRTAITRFSKKLNIIRPILHIAAQSCDVDHMRIELNQPRLRQVSEYNSLRFPPQETLPGFMPGFFVHNKHPDGASAKAMNRKLKSVQREFRALADPQTAAHSLRFFKAGRGDRRPARLFVSRGKVAGSVDPRRAIFARIGTGAATDLSLVHGEHRARQQLGPRRHLGGG